MSDNLRDLVAAELAEPVDPRVSAMAAAIAAEHPGAARAVLFYGSCLREKQLDGLMLDFYLIVSSYREAFGRGWKAFANRVLPPNVFPFAHDGLAAKYAVLSEDHFLRECSVAARSVSVWARFAQPTRLVWTADDAARKLAVAAVSQAPETLLILSRSTLPDEVAHDTMEHWRQGFRLTYASELRAERNSRPDAIVDHDPDRYRRFAAAAGFPRDEGIDVEKARSFAAAWRSTHRRGKVLTLLRLAKATTTYGAGGVDYIAWKINRHAGTTIEVRPWQRRWPILGALVMLPRLWRRGAIR